MKLFTNYNQQFWVLLLVVFISTVATSGQRKTTRSRSGDIGSATGIGDTYDTGEDVVTPAPRFLSRSQTFRAVIGDTLVLPCRVENLGTYVLLWRRGSSVLTAGSLMVTRDSRFRLQHGYDLQVRNVGPQDAGDYVCQIGDRDNRDQIHTVEIMVPPTVRTSPGSGQMTARKGGSVTLECKASGNPVPTIRWRRKDGAPLAGVGHGSSVEQRVRDGFSITLDNVDRHQAGVYQCTADNGIGEPVTVDIQLHVLYPPEINVERSWVHSGEGYNAQLVCIVYGDPHPEVYWYQNSFPLDGTEKRTMETRGNKHILTIRKVVSSDFGNYSCIADNSLGRAKKYMELSGRPGPAEFRSAPYSRSRHSYNLTWVVHSYPPLDEVRVLYRRVNMNQTYQSPGTWNTVLVPLENGYRDGSATTMSYTIRNLQPSAVFEAVVQAKNRYGWNEVSDLHHFYTRGSEPELADMEPISRSSSASSSSSSNSVTFELISVFSYLVVSCLSVLAVSAFQIVCNR